MSKLVFESVSARLGRHLALQEVSLAVEAGSLLALVGPNGAGKTTALRTMAGLVPPASGRVLLDGQVLGETPASLRARRIAYLAQDSQAHWPITVWDLALLGRLPHGQRVTAADRAIVERTLQAHDLMSLKDRPATALSGGELRRALLARALATEPDVLLADEPTAALDPGHGLDVMAALRRAAGDGMAVVVVTHDLGLAQRFADRLALLHEGRLRAIGPAGDVLTADNLARCYGVRGDPLGMLERIDASARC